MEKRNMMLLLIGALAGAGIAWLLFSDDGKKLLNELKEKIGEMKDELGADYEKVKQLITDLVEADPENV